MSGRSFVEALESFLDARRDWEDVRKGIRRDYFDCERIREWRDYDKAKDELQAEVDRLARDHV